MQKESNYKKKKSFKNAINFPAKAHFMLYFYEYTCKKNQQTHPKKSPLSFALPQLLAPAFPAGCHIPAETFHYHPGAGRQRGVLPANGFYPRDASVNDVFQNLWVDFTMRKKRLECHYNKIPTHSPIQH